MSSNSLALGRQLGSLAICAKVAAHEARLQEGVVRTQCGLCAALVRRSSGATARVAPDGSLQINVSVVVRYGMDPRAVTAAVQKAVIGGVGRISDRPVGAVNVFVRGFEPARPQRRLYDKSGTQ
jgi:uncharacterized alkaline shock family protein YloU